MAKILRRTAWRNAIDRKALAADGKAGWQARQTECGRWQWSLPRLAFPRRPLAIAIATVRNRIAAVGKRDCQRPHSSCHRPQKYCDGPPSSCRRPQKYCGGPPSSCRRPQKYCDGPQSDCGSRQSGLPTSAFVLPSPAKIVRRSACTHAAADILPAFDRIHHGHARLFACGGWLAGLRAPPAGRGAWLAKPGAPAAVHGRRLVVRGWMRDAAETAGRRPTGRLWRRARAWCRACRCSEVPLAIPPPNTPLHPYP